MQSQPTSIQPESPSRSRRIWRNGLILLVGIALLALPVWLWRDPAMDMTNVHPLVSELELPLRAVEVGQYMDGGTIGGYLIDRRGRVLHFRTPWQSGYTELLIAREDSCREPYIISHANIPVVSCAETSAFIQHLLDTHGFPLPDAQVAYCLWNWRRSRKDEVRKRFYEELWVKPREAWGAWRSKS